MKSIINNSDYQNIVRPAKIPEQVRQHTEPLGTDRQGAFADIVYQHGEPPELKYKEVFFSLGGTQSAVYATEVSLEGAYTTEESEKMELFALADGRQQTGYQAACRKQKKSPIINNLKIRNMEMD